jgi:hypothetical protein
MSNFEAYETFLGVEARDYSRYYAQDLTAEFIDGTLRLYRRAANPNAPQIARAFRDASGLTAGVVFDLVTRAGLPRWSRVQQTDTGDIIAIDEGLDGCITPSVDRLQANRLSCHDGVSAWLSTTHSKEVADTLWPHLPLIELEVPISHVLPVTAVTEDTLARLGKRRPVSQHETGVFGAIRDEWIINIR